MDLHLDLNLDELPGVYCFLCTTVYFHYRQLVLNVCCAEVYVNLYVSSLHLAFIILPADITLNVYFAQFQISETTF